MSKQTYKVGFFFRRQFTMAAAEAPADIKNIFNRYSDECGVMSVEKLHHFLIEVQKEKNASLEDAQIIINNHGDPKHTGLHLDAFFKSLFSDINPPIDPKLGIHHDMTAPLSHYYIYTGHNSYLTGNQLSSDCSVVPIIQALQRGVRVIELDIWPNSDKDDIDVLHGRTLTAPVALVKCLRSIKEHAFSASEYPVVITLEDHLTPDLQEKVAEMITQTFGDMLFAPSECLKELPSPESLKKRVLISTKPPKEYLLSKEVKEKDDLKKDAEVQKMHYYFFNPVIHCQHNVDEGEDDEDDEGDSKSEKSATLEYKRLIAIHAGKGKGGLSDWLRVDPNKVRRLSLSEQELERAVDTRGKEIIRFTQQNLLRIYPKGIRVDSSNYDPLVGWMHGAQMVAFNMQFLGSSTNNISLSLSNENLFWARVGITPQLLTDYKPRFKTCETKCTIAVEGGTSQVMDSNANNTIFDNLEAITCTLARLEKDMSLVKRDITLMKGDMSTLSGRMDHVESQRNSQPSTPQHYHVYSSGHAQNTSTTITPEIFH
ncbi:Phosphoinositide phospholipase C 4 [Capsicum baccatum]|uniref:Phosphoinositide phospholipase C n=1 Tax=Capsicum baccatum TaxID=33114 RepID=A0A2G2WI36_CAPBA|nr:Phosphoinositide phospholipase C 4 [Capsicum baccatum]